MNNQINTVLTRDNVGLVRLIHNLDKVLYNNIIKQFEHIGISGSVNNFV